MKKITLLLLIALMCISLFSCGTPSPTEVVDSFLIAAKANDSEKMATLYAGDVDDMSFDEASGTDADSYSDELEALLKEKFLQFEYTLSNETIKDNKASVDVHIKTYPFGDVFKSGVGEFMAQGLALAFSGASDAALDIMMNDIFVKKLNEAVPDYEGDATISLTKTDEGWVIDEFSDDSEFINVFTGGMIDFANDMSKAFQ